MKKLSLFTVVCCAAACLFICCNNSAGNTGKAGDSGSAAGAVAGSGDDLYFEETITGGGSGMTMNGMTKMYFSGGKVRMEMDFGMKAPGAAAKGGKSSPMVIIGDISKPHESISIDDDKKTYSVNKFTDSSFSDPGGIKTNATVTKEADATILGFHCTHARVISKKEMGSFFHMVDTVDLWESMDVPMAATWQHWLETYKKGSGAMFGGASLEQLKKVGCEGFMVKMQMRSQKSGVTMELTKVEHRNLSGSLFKIPAGYTEDKSSAIGN